MPYKRNQIEEAISRLFDPKSKAVPAECARASSDSLSSTAPSSGRKIPNKPNYAFFSDDAPGSGGADTSFSEYDAGGPPIRTGKR
jgi:hypothetical protein